MCSAASFAPNSIEVYRPGAVVGMKYAVGSQGLVSRRHLQGVAHQAGAHMVAHRIADDFPVEAVDHRRQPVGSGRP